MNVREKKLLQAFRDLPEAQQQSLLDFADFLAGRAQQAGGEETAQPKQLEPLPIERPVQESVIKAVRRLRQTYPMLDSAKLLNEASSHVTQHIVHGRPAIEVIDELEVMFARCYDEFKSGQ